VPAFLIARIAQSALVLLAMSLLVFTGIYAVGDPIAILASPDSTPEDLARLRAALGLDAPLWTQYGVFLERALHGDLGRSFIHHAPALAVILERLPATMELALAALAIALVPGIPLGLYAGLRPESLGGRAIMTGSILGFSLPTFWVGLMLIMVFSVWLGWLPASGRGPTVDIAGMPVSFTSAEGLSHLLLPAVNLALFKLSLVIRLVRAGTREALAQDYVKFARAKGLTMRRVVGVHVLKNILVPVVTVTGLEFGSLIAFAVVTETVFAWPGMGKLLIESIGALDRPVVVAYLCVVVVMFVAINLLVDIACGLIDPRIRQGAAGGAGGGVGGA
jgi:peptide/nickel transport system permease protein